MPDSVALIRETLAANNVAPDTLLAYRRRQPLDGELFAVAVARRPGSFYVTTIDAVARKMQPLAAVVAEQSAIGDHLAAELDRPLNWCWCGEAARFVNPATDGTPEQIVCPAHVNDGYRPLEAR